MRRDIPITVPGNSQLARVPRPKNSFLIYQEEYMKNFAHLAVTGLFKTMSFQWTNESPSVQTHYSQLAGEARLEHMKLYPQYKFMPRKRGSYNRCRTSVAKGTEPTSLVKEKRASIILLSTQKPLSSITIELTEL
ncbi:hypothetical protein BGX21_006612 [Mortierella sp. AD011]|nr:hypothetical protein BGX21_006612 [Mortierella sp. AD011]